MKVHKHQELIKKQLTVKQHVHQVLQNIFLKKNLTNAGVTKTKTHLLDSKMSLQQRINLMAGGRHVDINELEVIRILPRLDICIIKILDMPVAISLNEYKKLIQNVIK